MKYSQAKQGRTFVIRLEDGEIIHDTIEAFARSQGIHGASLIILGGADEGSRLVVGPDKGRGVPVVPMEHSLDGVHECTGTGTLFPDEDGQPVLHMHIACGRNASSITGCVRAGVKAWHVLEVILIEFLDSTAVRRQDATTGFKLMDPA
jgi:predicted DNA-binding protein with PD1-like motif